MIRVAQVVRPAAGGIRRHVGSLVSRLSPAEFPTTLFAPATFVLDPPSSHVTHVPVVIGATTALLADLRSILGLARRLRGRFDLVHAHGLRGAVVGVPAARLARVPSIFTAHNVAPAGRGAASRALRVLGGWAVPVAVSQAVAASLAVHGISPSQIQVIPNGIDFSRLATQPLSDVERRETIARFAEQSDARHALLSGWLRDGANLAVPLLAVAAAGRLSPEKGFDVLIRGFDLWSRSNDEADKRLLLVAGAGPELSRLSRDAAGVSNAILIGPVPDVAPLFRSADIVVVPSREEGQGLVAIEAMAASRPVIASHVGGLTETVIDNETGILVPREEPASIASALDLLASSPALRRQMGEAGHARALDLFTLDTMMERLTELYRSTVR